MRTLITTNLIRIEARVCVENKREELLTNEERKYLRKMMIIFACSEFIFLQAQKRKINTKFE